MSKRDARMSALSSTIRICPTPPSQDTNTTRVSVYLKNVLVDWCDQRAEQLGESRQAAIVEAVRDHWNLYGLPAHLEEVLLAEKKSKGYDNRTYLRYVVSLHAQALYDLRRGAEPKKSPTRAK
jgi:hypothetical protein